MTTNLFAVRAMKKRSNARTKTIQAYVEAETARTGRRPTIDECAALMAISRARVELHYRILGYTG